MGQEEHRGVQMARALRIDRDPPRLVTAEDIDTHISSWRALNTARRGQQPPSILQCEDPHCCTPLTAVPTHTSEKWVRAAHFRRWPKTPHNRRCSFNVEHRIARLIDASEGTLERAGSRDGCLRYRLVLPATLSLTTPPARDGQGADALFHVQSTALLNTAAKIAALLADYERRRADPHVEFLARCAGQDVLWDNFFYAPPRIFVLRQRLERGPLEHPVAVLGRIKFNASGKRGPSRWCGITYRDQSGEQLVFLGGDTSVVDRVIPTAGKLWVAGLGMWTLPRSSTRYPDRPTLTLTQTDTAAVIDADTAAFISKMWWPGE